MTYADLKAAAANSGGGWLTAACWLFAPDWLTEDYRRGMMTYAAIDAAGGV